MAMSNTFWIVAVVLGIGVCYKLPAVLRGGRNPLARQVGALLLLATAVFTFAAPATIAAVNDLVGIPNFSAPWVYSLLTAFCASCLLLIIKWRGGQNIRRVTWWVYGSYGAVIVALWVCFALGDHDVERLRDLDTYYATTPWMREMIVLYLLGHTVAVLITSALLWNWRKRVRGTGWLHAGVVLLSIGYALNLLYDAAKLTPVVARWHGHSGLDWMSTSLAPPIAGVVGLLIALGFIIPHAGERVSKRTAARREYRALAPLARALHQVQTASTPVSLPRFAPLEMRLIRRKTVLRDALRQLHPYLDPAEHDRALRSHLNAGAAHDQARVLADAAAVTAAAERLTSGAQAPEGPPAITVTDDLVSLSRALRDLPTAPRRNAAHPESSVTS